MCKLILIFSFLLVVALPARSQELNCVVNVNADQVQSANPQYFISFGNAIRDFMNNTKWTDDRFAQEEKIDCSLNFTVTGQDGSRLVCTLQVNSSRPVYNTAYNSPIFNFIDKTIVIDYVEFQPLQYVENNYSDDLSAVLAYYAYMIIGADYDTYSELGGTKFFTKAQAILNQSTSSTMLGWRSTDRDDRNRYYLVYDRLDNRYQAMRKGLYNYHRKGLDIMAGNPADGRQAILGAIKVYDAAKQQFPNALLVQNFADAKSNEIIDLFAKAAPQAKSEVRSMMQSIDVVNSGRYAEKLK